MKVKGFEDYNRGRSDASRLINTYGLQTACVAFEGLAYSNAYSKGVKSVLTAHIERFERESGDYRFW